MTEARDIQNAALVIDGLSYHADGYTGDLRQGGLPGSFQLLLGALASQEEIVIELVEPS